ncbi:SulP family inorganic anion transporter [Paucibacter sediminis]|uniref:SulP family inorganic anion transporter n=1 Tax=Paucibacter sediminis TaxID=3019553 RepID=A0AA95SQA2_9BURK|nr:SulP family inorganic anion transporter [Paucibacter sp. S2-9]WIT13235.1 SulP family inorganic anion transporter [Paucibacter sp. S2-9]
MHFDLSGWRDYRQRLLQDDLLAALVVSVLLIPQSLAYAMLAGLPAQVGLYASLLPLLFYAALGSSPFLAVGPVAVLALMIAQTLGLAPAGVSPGEAALVLAAEIGLILALAAALRLDALAALLSVPVLHGFETGATLTIAASQLPVLLGSPAQGFDLPTILQSAAASGWTLKPVTAAFGLGALALLVLARQGLTPVLARLAPLLLLLCMMALAWRSDALGHGVSLVGQLPPLHLPFTLPRLQAELWWALLPGAAVIALVGYVSSLVVAESLARRHAQRVTPRRELMGLAAANLAAALSGGMPVAASFSRSVLMSDAGARTRVAGVLVAFFMAMAMLLLAPALAWLPKSVLAATIMVAVLSGLKLGPYAQAWRYARPECLLMLGVTLLVLCWGVTGALGLGVLGSIALLLQRTARPHVALIGRVPGTEHYRNVGRYQVECQPGVLGLRIDESLLFTNVRNLSDVVQGHLDHHPEARRVVLLMSPVNGIDFSGLEALRELHDTLARQGVRLDLSEVKGPVLDRLKASDWQRWFKGRLYLSHHHGMVDGLQQAPDWVSP